MSKQVAYAGYESKADLAAKIDNEGGMDYFFRSYANVEDFKDTPLYKIIKKYIKISNELDNALNEEGITNE